LHLLLRPKLRLFLDLLLGLKLLLRPKLWLRLNLSLGLNLRLRSELRLRPDLLLDALLSRSRTLWRAVRPRHGGRQSQCERA
jgi:hypothetical protein